MNPADSDRPGSTVTLWLDPVCPFSWNTARWLRAVAEKTGMAVDWQLMSLAVLNEGRELPAPQQARMRDSQQVGRLMAAIARENGAAGWTAAYFAFGERYFDGSEPLDDSLVAHVLTAAGARDTTAAVTSDASLDEVVRRGHQAAQDALGETGGSPILRIDGHAFFGPVLTALPDVADSIALFDAVATLGAVPQFAQLQRPRTAG
ncbi:DsbA family protein [Mycobacterium paraffinicum]|uniref:DSBA-like thioredoxin domain-containing protein n=1 Tax=Mycobacterium paraffinicum TaxID=53378 RepID=A0ABP8RAW0_9MYCO|nr:DsbA family protein [Mycobacterium paraffinicum]MCV7311402.1 DsbA family protein [Mycobacterium paraffinicum]